MRDALQIANMLTKDGATVRKMMKMQEVSGPSKHVGFAADIVAAYVANNSVPVGALPSLIRSVHDALAGVAGGAALPTAEAPKPAVNVRKSITDEYIVCLEDGKKFRSLKRHLRTQYDMTPEAYRAKWGLPLDYPMVAPSYAKARSDLAKGMGLGQQRRREAVNG